ncbi:Uncharacterised protein [Mycobacteroides abscessus subsp. abscessus]|nr:Uncharacterised protein [Mycobacteroides abscessus subsp. abscessus]
MLTRNIVCSACSPIRTSPASLRQCSVWCPGYDSCAIRAGTLFRYCLRSELTATVER